MANKARNIITSYCSAKGKQRNIFLSGYISGEISVNALKKKEMACISGGKFKKSHHKWSTSSNDNIILDIISQGLKLYFSDFYKTRIFLQSWTKH